MAHFADEMLSQARPDRVRNIPLPRRGNYFPSPVDWQDEVLYFIFVDRFSDGTEHERPLLDRQRIGGARGDGWNWAEWAESGANRWQGGNLRGVISKVDYLERLGVTTLWLSPVFKQRCHENSYHGYAIQDFLDIDPHFGERADLVQLVRAAHDRGMRVLLDVVFQHSGTNWLYPQATPGGIYEPVYTEGRYPFGAWRGDEGQPIDTIRTREDGIWPAELQSAERYTRAGAGNLAAGDINDPHAEHKRSDFYSLRDFDFDSPRVIEDLARCFKYWIALTDVDGFRLDTLKHVSLEQARAFCGTIKEFAANLGKHNFFLVGEVAGGDFTQDRYLDVLQAELNAALDIGETRLALGNVAKGLAHPNAYFDGFDPGLAIMGSHRHLGTRHVSICDDHDHVFGTKLRFSSDAASEHQVVAAVALQLFTLGIPCIYYGTEQAFAGPESRERRWLPEWGSADRYLREAMFGPLHPRLGGRAGLAPDGVDAALPGFGPFGTSGRHCFDEGHAVFRRIRAMLAARAALPVLRHGRQYVRPLSIVGASFATSGAGEILAWSRVLDDEEALCAINTHGERSRGADVLVDASMNEPESGFCVVVNTAQAANADYGGTHPVGSMVPTKTREGVRFLEIRDLPPSEVLVLTNRW
ncbi:MAG TPA: alpha-amylase family glycosyl hydrolase [Polyangiaceae bacterium]|nr:alpha-amylase family glycosyl hydrolase [Polyangiaceae bacterium]